MAKQWIKKALTSQTVRLSVQNSASTTGGMLTGLVFNTAGLVCKYARSDQTTVTTVSLVTKTLGTWVSGGFKELDPTNMPGVYELDLPNAAFTSGTTVHVALFGAANMVPVYMEIELVAVDNQDAQRFGLAVLPATGTLLVKPAVTLAAADVTGNLPANAVQIAGGTPTTFSMSDFGTQVQTSMTAQGYTTTRAGKIDFLTQIDTTPATLADASIKTATFASGATLPRTTLVDTTTNLTNGAGGTAPTVDEIATRLLLNPANKFNTSSAGGVFIAAGGINLAAYGSEVVDQGTVVGSPTPSTTAFQGSTGLKAEANYYLNSFLRFATGANAGSSARRITGYSSSRGFTFSEPWLHAPASGDAFYITGKVEV